MPRIQGVSLEKADTKVKPILETLNKKFGRVPNIFQNMGNSEAVLSGYLALNDAVGKTTLSPSLREKLALIVGQTNNCSYCLSAHTAIAKAAGLQEQEILKARKGETQDKKEQAILRFAKTVVEKRGTVSTEEVATLKKEGVSDKELTEIILVILTNMFTNYFNHITDPVVDFPEVPQKI